MHQGEDGFDFLRVSLEKRVHFPVVLAVTSAQSADGSGLVASGLARAFAGAGRRTMLVAAQAESDVAGIVAKSTRGTLAHTGLRALVAEHAGESSAVGAALHRLRESYDVVVLASDAIVESSVAFELASLSDGVLVAVRLGRKPCVADARALALLESCGADILGIVPTNARGRATSAFRKALPAAADDVRPLRAQAVELGR